MIELVASLGPTVNYALTAVCGVLAAVVLGLVFKIAKLNKEIQAKEAAGAAANGNAPTGHTKPMAPIKASAAAAPPVTQVVSPPQAAPAPAAPAGPPDPGMVTQYQAGTGEGIPELEAQLEQDPENPDLLDWLAFMYYSNGKLEQAVSTYQRAIAINYDNEHQHYYLGNSFYKLGNIERACEEWEVVISLKPDGKLAKNAEERIEKCRKGQTIAIEAGSRSG